MTGNFSHRLATEFDPEALREIMALSIATLQKGFLTEQQIAASTSVMGLDTQLIKDGTYFIIQSNDRIAGCGGWSFRNTLYGGDHSLDLRNPNLLNPAIDAARIRAMTHIQTSPAKAWVVSLLIFVKPQPETQVSCTLK